MPLLALLAGCFACATSVLWIKLSQVDPILLTGFRLAIASLALAPWAARDWRRLRAQLNWSHLRDTLLPSAVLAAHFVTWIYGARLTLASNGTLIVNLIPLATPFLLAALLSESITRREIVATLLACVGLAILFAADFHLSEETFLGDMICFVSMLLIALYLVLGRRLRHHPTTLLYVTPVYAIAALISFVLAGAVGATWPENWLQEAPWVLLLALVPTVIGHSLLNRAMRQIRGQVVAVVNMSQFLFAGVLAWIILEETPGLSFYVSSLLIVVAGLVVVWQPSPPEDEVFALPEST